MLQPAQNQAPKIPTTLPTYTPMKTVSPPLEQATIGRSLVIKGEVTGAEALYIDGRVEGTIDMADNRVTIGRNGSVTADISAREVVIMGSVKGNIECTDRLDIRAEGSLVGDVIAARISVEDGAMLKSSVEVQVGAHKQDKTSKQTSESEKPKVAAATAGA